MTVTISPDQLEVARSLAFKAAYWLGPMPANLPHMEPLPERLAGMVFSLFPELEGDGNLPPCRLSPKVAPDVDLVDFYLPGQWPDTNADNPYVRVFLTAIRARLDATQGIFGAQPHQIMGGLLADICQIIEDGYVLALCDVDEDGNVTGEGPDVAPGLVAAVQAAWVEQAGRG